MNDAMDEQTLERIAIDRAAGEWNDDLERLLQAHLSAQPQAQMTVNAADVCVRLAYTALCSGREPAMPSFDPPALLSRAAWRRRTGIGMAMAACLALGVTVGLWSAPTAQHLHTSSFDAWLANASMQRNEPSPNSLWSRQRWQQRIEQQQPQPAPTDSPWRQQVISRIFGG